MFSLEPVPAARFQSSSRVTKHVLITYPRQALSHTLPLLLNSLCVGGCQLYPPPPSHSTLKSGSFLTLPSLLRGLLVLQHRCHFPPFHSPVSDFLACLLVCGSSLQFPTPIPNSAIPTSPTSSEEQIHLPTTQLYLGHSGVPDTSLPVQRHRSPSLGKKATLFTTHPHLPSLCCVSALT